MQSQAHDSARAGVGRPGSHPGPAAAAWGLMLLWAILLLTPQGWRLTAPAWAGRLLQGAALLWFLLNFTLWLVPEWRRSVVRNRGPLLGLGFAFAAALVGAAVDGVVAGRFASAAGAFALRLLWLSLPFVLPFLLRSPYPHPADLLVLAYALALPHLPGFGGSWLARPGAPAGGFFGAFGTGAAAAGAGHLSAMALVATYFCGARPWTGAALDWTVRPGDLRHTARIAAWAAAGACIALAGTRVLAGAPGAGSPVTSAAGAALLFGMTVAALFESFAFHAVLQAGLTRLLPRRISARARRAADLLAPLAAAAIHAWIGLFGLAGAPGFGFALGLAYACRGVARLFPVAIGHAGGLLIAALIFSVLE